MVRKATSPTSEGSQKENAAFGTNELSRLDKNKTKSARRAARVESDEEGDQAHDATQEDGEDGKGEDYDVPEDDEEEQQGSPKGRKRARANSLGEARPPLADSKGKAKMEPKTLERDVDGFLPGSIVRVQLRNFVTYDYVEFAPGPYLNMILGPNGTGKSSIACAICLGLNFPPSVLGRASELNSFVKIGTEDGHIEIELKGAKGKSNLVIRRTLSARSKSNQFTINGQPASGKEINNRMQELNVQVSNLCSFLPQDKVAEFARMTPQQLLRETQRAAGNANLTSWHDTLIEAGKERKQMKERMDADRSQLKNMEDRNATLEKDVKKYEERQKLEREIEFLELLLPFKEYSEAKVRYDDLKARQRKLHEKVRILQAKNAPILAFKENLQKDQDAIEREREAKKTVVRNKFGTMQKKWDENERLESQAEDLKNKLDNLKKAEKNRLKKIENLEKEIARIQHQIDNPPEFEDVNALNSEINEIKNEGRDVTSRQEELQHQQREIVNEQSQHKRSVEEVSRRIQQLDNVDVQKLEALTRWHKDTGDTVKWLRQNRHRFKMEIFEPPMLSISVPDKRFVNAIEACFSANDLQTFVAQCNEDYKLLNQLIADTPDALGRKARINSWYRDPGQVYPPPASHEELRSLGFDGYAMDYITCPEGMRWFLQSAVNLHRTPIALDPRRVDPTRAMETLSREGNVTYFVGNVMNMVRRSRYGKRLAQNSTREIHQARNLVAATVDPAVKQGLERSLNEAREHVKTTQEKLDLLLKEDGNIRKQHATLREKLKALTERKTKSEKAQSDWQGLRHKLDNKERDLKRERNAPSVEAERTKLKAEILQLTKKRIGIVTDYAKMMNAAIAEQAEMTRLSLRYLQISANKSAVEKIYEERNGEHSRALEAWRKVYEEYEAAKTDVHTKLKISMEKLGSVKDETRERFKEWEESGQKDERDAEEVHTTLGTLQAQLDLNHQTNAGVVDQFKKRQTEIATLTETIQEREEKLNKVEERINRTHALWYPALNTLVESIGEKFSAAFDRIGCAGEIKISENDDYDKWAIDILVKFRDDEKLQLLTAERQSGGERSLTTILYLMSLTAHARAPFSLVDEINQGMDARAERAVHNSLVDVTCKADSGQYFLITPKLLPDLNYHERMKVLCVNNGEWLPDEGLSGNLMGMIDNYVRLQSQN